MKRTRSKSKKLLLLSLVLAISMLSIGFTIAASAEDNSDNTWSFSSDSVKDPMYVQKYFTSLPRAYEAEIKLPSGDLGSSSPIIANWTQSDTRDAFGFQLSAAGKPTMYYYQNAYDAANSKNVTTKYKADFSYAVPRDQWVRLAVVNEVSNGNSIFKLYVNGVLQETLTMTGAATFDAVYSQQCMRELSIGNDGKNYFKGEIRNVAVYENALTADEAAKTAKENMQGGNVNLKAYYDATMSGNDKTFFKDQTGNGHDAYSAFFERKEPVKDYDYSFAFIGDTQFLVERDVNNNTTQYASPIFDWIVENKDEKNIQHVFGLGDITDNNSDAEWEYAVTLYEKLGNAGVDYSLISGNHDDYTTPAAKYNNYFGKVSSFVNSIDGYFQEGRIENFYTKFDVGTHKYLVIGLLYGAKDDVLEWANEVVAQNYDREVIVITHSLFNAAGEWALPDTSAQTTTSRKELNNGIDIWDKFISQHSNIIIAAAGHISGDVIKAGKSVGVNGNVVNTFLINPQGFDMATGYDTGMVAMFYFSDDGSSVQVEYVSTTKTLRAQDYDPDSEDILYSEKNNFSFTVREADADHTYTKYGSMPNEAIEGKTFAVFTDGKFLSAHETWNAATQAAADIFTADKTKHVIILLLDDYTNTSDPIVGLAANYANGSLTVDLGKHTFTRSDTFLDLSSSSDLTNVAPSNITVKNGTVRSEGGEPIIGNRITDEAYPSEKVWNITFEGVTVGYGESMTTSNGFIYQAFTNGATADEAQLGTKTNIVFNNCTIDLKTNSSGSAVTLFALKDDRSDIDKIDVSVKVGGGTILADIADLSSVTFYTLNEGSDSILFSKYNNSYTKLKTHTTAKDYAHYQGKFPTDDGDRYFVEISESQSESVYELRNITVKSGSVTASWDVNANAKYLSLVDYPFFVFDMNGTFCGAFGALYGSDGVGAMNAAIETVLAPKDTVYVVMRRDYTMGKSETYSNLAYANGTVVVDFGGFSLISGSDRSSTTYIFNSAVKGDDSDKYPSYFVIKNGSIRTYTSPVIRFSAYNGSKADANKLMSWTFDGVTLGLVSGSTYDRFFNVSNSTKATSVAPINLNFNDCTIDLDTVKPSGDFYIFRTNFASGTSLKADVRVNGGQIIAKDLANVYFDNLDTHYGSTLCLGKGSDGEYIKVIIPVGKAFGFQTDSDTFGNITKKTDYGADVSFTLMDTADSKNVYGIGVDCDYGAVPPEYADTEKYPFFVFDKDGTFYGAFGALYGSGGVGAMNAAIETVLAPKDTVYVVMRRDYTMGKSETYSNLAYANGTVVVDLGGFSLISGSDRTSDTYIFNSAVKGDSSDKYPSYFVIKNGSIRTYASPVIRFSAYNGKKADANKLMSWTFEGVTLGLVSGSTYTRFFNVSNAKSATSIAPINLYFNDCIFDLETVKPSGDFYVLRTNFASGTSLKADVRVNGGKILANSVSKITLDNLDTHYGSTLKFGMGSNGEFLRVVLPTGTSFTNFSSLVKKTVSGTDVKFYLDSSKNGKDTYTFGFETKYGIAPAKYEDKEAYPFFIFTENGTFKAATSEWALDNSASALSSSKNAGYKVLMRRNFENKNSQYNNLSHTQDVTIDLNGFTLKNSGVTLFMAQKKPQSGKEQNSKVTLINGTVILGSRALVKMDTSASTTSGQYGFDFTFENITVKLIDGAKTDAFICQDEFASGDPVQYCNFTFINCVFDLSNAAKDLTLFDVSDKLCKVTAIIKGGEIITSSYGVTVWKNYESDPGSVTANPESSLTFAKDENGAYTTITTPSGAALPIKTVNGGALAFVKTADDGTTATYSLAAYDLSSFTPKTSITLGSELVYNIYVPVTANLKSYTVDGATVSDAEIVTLDDGNEYYHIAVKLPSSMAARNIVLKAVITVGDKDYSATWTMSIPKYAKKILASDATEVEKTLVKDVLAYIKAAYIYFDATDSDEVSALIDEILDGYNREFKKADVTNNTENGLYGVIIVLEEKPAIRFVLPAGKTAENYGFTSGSRSLSFTTGTVTIDGVSYCYAEVSLYAYQMTKDIIYSDGTVSGSYNFASYYDFVTSDDELKNDAELITIVEKFYNYTVSAEAYRASVSK